MSVCFREKIKIDPHTLSDMIIASGQDMRQVRCVAGSSCGCGVWKGVAWVCVVGMQVLHNLSLWSASDEPDTGVKEGVAKGMIPQKLKLQVRSWREVC